MSIKKRIPWWLKMTIKIFLSFMPFKYDFWQKLGLFRHGSMDKASYFQRIISTHLKASKLSPDDLQGKKIIEMGPGDSVSSAIVFSSYNAKAILIDAGDFSVKDITQYKAISKELYEDGYAVKNIDHVTSFIEMLDVIGAKYLTNGLMSFSEIEDNSIDFIFSEAVLEHIHKDEFLPIMKECKRILKNDGVISHSIDLKDHLDYALNNLRFSETVWESKLFKRGGIYTNRISFQEMIEIFESSGFKVDVKEVNRWEKLPTPRKKMALPFRNYSEDNLCVSAFSALLTPK
tara:strand:- start:12325 stop:13191 length:867 start_codon:yes stop_codon:yes gene_type:complete